MSINNYSWKKLSPKVKDYIYQIISKDTLNCLASFMPNQILMLKNIAHSTTDSYKL